MGNLQGGRKIGGRRSRRSKANLCQNIKICPILERSHVQMEAKSLLGGAYVMLTYTNPIPIAQLVVPLSHPITPQNKMSVEVLRSESCVRHC